MSARNKLQYDPKFYDEEEREIVEGLRSGDFVSAKDLPARKKVLKQAADNTLKRKPVTLRLLEDDISLLKVRALEDGLPYQTLLSSIIHKYVTGRLKEIEKA
jgi:predicted DNA binding CopG/RHH family protein